MSEGLTLQAVFAMQDRAATHNEGSSAAVQKQLAFVSQAIALIFSILSSGRFAADKQHVLRVLGADVLSSVISSVRIGLWGNLPEGVVLLRSALETCAILAATVETQDYPAVALEIRSKRMRNHSYRQALAQLGQLGERIDSLHGRLSNLGAHVTSTRLHFASYEWDGLHYDRIGAALDPKSAALAMFWASDVCLHILESLEKAYSQEGIAYPADAGLVQLREMLRETKREFGDAEQEM